jgi:hypothetical protein
LAETSPGESSRGDLERMARRRFQDPKPQRRGNFWSFLFYQDVIEEGRRVRKRRRENIAPISMPEREVKKIVAERLRPMNHGLFEFGIGQQV